MNIIRRVKSLTVNALNSLVNFVSPRTAFAISWGQKKPLLSLIDD